MASLRLVLLLSIFVIFEANVARYQSKSISLVTSLVPDTSWDSPSGHFKFGFYPKGGGYLVGIWLVTKPEITVVWTANRDDSPLSSNATLILTEGKLILRTEQNGDKIIAETSTAVSAWMLDSGNFVLRDNHSDIIWESFDFPTDTILQGQSLDAGHELFSSVSESNHSTGRYRLKMQEDGNLVLYPINTIDKYSEAYWASNTDNWQNNHMYLNYTGELLLFNGTRSRVSTLHNSYSDEGFNSSIIFRATLGYDGILRLFSHYFVTELGAYNKSESEWSVPESLCDVKGFCGLNSFCTLDDVKPVCRCIPGTDYVDPNQDSNGCKRNFTEEICERTQNVKASYNITPGEKMTWDDYPYIKEDISEEDCKKSCLEDCNCDAALYNSGFCTKHKLPLKSAKREESTSTTAYFKVGARPIRSNNGSNPSPEKPAVIVRETSKKAMVIIFIVTIGFITCSCIFLAISGFLFLKYRVAKYKWLLETGSLGLTDELSLRSFSYSELKRATNGFKENLGRGSFGAVYRGALYKGEKLVAVKRLEKVIVRTVDLPKTPHWYDIVHFGPKPSWFCS